jgi:phage terminase small subunit
MAKNKQELFAEEYIVDLNGTQAAIRAGYSPKTASVQSARLLGKANVQAKIAELKAARSQETGINARWVLEQAVKLHKRCMQEEKVTDKDGEPIGEYKFEHSGAAKSLELIGKHVDVKAFVEKVESEMTLKVDDSLAARLTGGSKR